MINSNIYIENRLVVDFDEYTAKFSDGGFYIFGDGEYKRFYEEYDFFVSLGNDSMNMFSTHIAGKFKFMDCRRSLGDL